MSWELEVETGTGRFDCGARGRNQCWVNDREDTVSTQKRNHSGTPRRASVRSLSECLDIGQMLAACRRALVDEERVASKNWHHSSAYRMIHVTLPRRYNTGNAADGPHQVDAVWRSPNWTTLFGR